MIRTYGWVAFAIWSVCQGAAAQEWAVKMFAVTSHDFGVVARGAKAEFDFVVQNIYEEDVHIASVRSSCGCTQPKILKDSLKTWEKSAIRAMIDTRSFLGRKDATLTVTLDRPFPAEVQLHVYVYIRGDVVVQPGVINFGTVAAGIGAVQKARISYAGRPDWQVLRVESANPHLTAEIVETERGPAGIKYDLTARLKPEAPAGYIQDHLVLVTNDYQASTARVPVPVEGIVGSAISVRPSVLMMATETGAPVTRQMVVQGREPFRIVEIVADDPRVRAAPSAESKSLHIIGVTFTGSTTTGIVNARLLVRTDAGKESRLEVPVQITISAPHGGGEGSSAGTDSGTRP